MNDPDRFAEIYDHLPTADDKRLFLCRFVAAISNHLPNETMNRCIDTALKVSGSSRPCRSREAKVHEMALPQRRKD